MWGLRKKLHRKGRHGSSNSSITTQGSVSDLEDRVVMLCEDLPNENESSSYESGRESRATTVSLGRESRSRSVSRSSFSRGSQSGAEQEHQRQHQRQGQAVIASRHPPISRDRSSYRQACYFEEQPKMAVTWQQYQEQQQHQYQHQQHQQQQQQQEYYQVRVVPAEAL